MDYFKEGNIELIVSSNQQLKTIKLINNIKGSYFDLIKLKQNESSTIHYLNWLRLNS